MALQNLEHHIQITSATVTAGSLQTVRTDRNQLVMVFQNLIGNAMKYQGTEPPQIRVGAVQTADSWQVSVSDNGVGFSQEYAAQIFEPFKRLHGATVPGRRHRPCYVQTNHRALGGKDLGRV